MQSQAEFIWGKVRSSEISTGMREDKERRRRRPTNFRDYASHIEPFGVANTATVLSIKTRADAFEAVSGDDVVDGTSQSTCYQRDEEC